MTLEMQEELWVYFNTPPQKLPFQGLILSFMGAKAEAECSNRAGSRFISGRSVVRDVRSRARKAYLELLTRPAATPVLSGKTLRQCLRGKDGISRWWYQRMSQKNSVGVNDHYLNFIQLYCIDSVAVNHGISTIHLVGASSSYAKCLEKKFTVHLSDPVDKFPPLYQMLHIFRGILGRLYFIFYYLFILILLRSIYQSKGYKIDVGFQGYWDWSIAPNVGGRLRDGYFSDLPAKLIEMGYKVGWFTRFSPRKDKGRGYFNIIKSLFELRKYPEIVFIERFLKISDVFRAALNIRYPVAWIMFSRSREFRSMFIKDSLDFYPVLELSLWSAFAGNDIPHNELFSIAASRYCKALRPKFILTFLELFIESRAVYAGMRIACPNVLIYTAQHAAYCSDKTFGILDKSFEFNGLPDHCPMPLPDGIFVMGMLSREFWMKNGFPEHKVLLTGGLRYQHIKICNNVSRKSRVSGITILLITGMNENLDFDMCEAVSLAAAEFPIIKLKVRDHPHYRITDRVEFNKFRSSIEVSRIDDPGKDLLTADIVIFTHSSLAEEALLMGIPVWQWQCAGFNTSIFADLPIIPSYTKIEDLKWALKRFIESPEAHYPDEESKTKILEACFGSDPRNASGVIAQEIKKQLTQYQCNQ